MKSKISFFNKTLFWKNVTLYWPIWTVHILILLIMQPFVLWVGCLNILHYGKVSGEEKWRGLIDILDIHNYWWIIIGVAVIAGMAVYSYLYNSKSANMIHSLPVDRRQLFGTNIVSGLSFLAVPQVISFFVTMLVCLSYDIPHVEYLGIWLLLCLGIDFIAFGIVTFCAFFTGQIIALPIYVVIVNYLFYMLYSIVLLITNFFAYGVSNPGIIDEDVVLWFSPLVKIYEEVGFYHIYDDYGSLETVALEGGGYVLLYTVVAAALYLAAYHIYKKRQIEQTGDLITVGWVKPIFKYGVGFCGAILCSIYFGTIFGEIGWRVSLPVFLIIMLIFGTIFYFVADMLVQKTFRVFKKKNWKNWGIFAICMFAGFGALYGYAKYEENYIPKAEKVDYAVLSFGYSSELEGEDMQLVFDVHEEILEHKDVFRNISYAYDTVTVSIEYVSGDESVVRNYHIPVELYEGDVLERIRTLEMDPDNFLRNQVAKNYKEIEKFENGNIGYEDEEYEYHTLDLSGADSEKLFKALIADANAGNLQKYNRDEYYAYVDYGEEDVKVDYLLSGASLCLNYQVPNDVAQKILQEYEGVNDGNSYISGWYYDEATDREYPYTITGNKVLAEIYVNFGPDCANILNTLIESGIIESREDIFW